MDLPKIRLFCSFFLSFFLRFISVDEKERVSAVMSVDQSISVTNCSVHQGVGGREEEANLIEKTEHCE